MIGACSALSAVRLITLTAGQLGLGDSAERASPCVLPALPAPQAVCCGDYHSILLSTSGEVFSWGCGEHGQLGHGDLETCSAPRLVRSLAVLRIDAVACGARHTLALVEGFVAMPSLRSHCSR